MRKYLILLIFVSLFLTLVSAETVVYDSQHDYHASVDASVTVECTADNDEDCYGNDNGYTTLELEVCGETADSDRGPRFNHRSYPVTMSFSVPGDVSCSVGQHQMSLVTGTGTELDTAELTVTGKNMDDNKGKYIYLGLRKNTDPNRLANFFLSNEGPDSQIDGAQVVFEEHLMLGQKDLGVKKAVLGQKVGFGDQLYDLVEGPCYRVKGGQNENWCEIGEEPILGAEDRLGSGNERRDAVSSISALHFRGTYRLPGEVIVAKEPFGGEKLFFMCRDGATMQNSAGEEITQVVSVADGGDSFSSLMQCDQTENTWKQVQECNDGLDNDGDGTIDYQSVDISSQKADSSCNSEFDNSEAPEDSDDCRIVIMNNADEIVYRYPGSNPDMCDGEEKLSSFQNEIVGHPVDNFRCEETSEGEVVARDFRNFDNDLSRANDFCKSKDLHTLEDSSEEVKAVEFFPTRELFESFDNIDQGIEVRDITLQGWEGQSFFGQNGWRTGMQTLHQAEQSYAYGRNTHEASTWARLGMTNLDGYRYSEPSNYEDAWGSGSPSGVSDPKFPGGFHGICDSEDWTYNLTWGCGSGMTIEFFEISPVADDNEENYTGLRVTQDQVSKWESFTGFSPTPADSSIGNLEVKARCWHGLPQQRPSDTSDILVMSKEVVENSDTILAGSIPINEDLSGNGIIGDERTFSCNYGFQQGFASSVWPSGLDTPYYLGNIVGPGDPIWFLVAGSNDNGVVRVSTKTVSPPDDLNWFSEASDTNNPSNFETVFRHFPTFENIGFDESDLRNPLDVCIERYGCP